MIPLPEEGFKYAEREKEARAHLRKYELDGWKGSWRDLTNPHRITKGVARVSFTRIVQPDTQTEDT